MEGGRGVWGRGGEGFQKCPIVEVHPGVSIRDSGDYIKVLLYSYHSTITSCEMHLTNNSVGHHTLGALLSRSRPGMAKPRL